MLKKTKLYVIAAVMISITIITTVYSFNRLQSNRLDTTNNIPATNSVVTTPQIDESILHKKDELLTTYYPYNVNELVGVEDAGGNKLNFYGLLSYLGENKAILTINNELMELDIIEATEYYQKPKYVQSFNIEDETKKIVKITRNEIIVNEVVVAHIGVDQTQNLSIVSLFKLVE